MSTFGDFKRNIGLAMAGKSPWGNGGDENADDSGADSGDDSGTKKPKGPRNPWLPTGGSDEPRRSANVEDIFKKRGSGGTGGGGGPGGPSFRLPQRPGGKSWLPVGLGLIGLVWIGTTSIHPIGTAEQGLVTWMGGKYSDTLEPGFQLTLPFPLQSVDKENVQEIRSRKLPEGEEQLILTGDQNLVDLSYLIRWKIDDLALFRFRLADPEDTVKEAAETAMRAAVAELDLDTVLSGEGRAQVEQNVRTRMQAILNSYRAGIAVQGVEIDKTDPPETVIDAFKDVSAAEQDAQADMNRARRYAQQLLAKAEGDSTAFNKIYDEYRLAPEVTRRRLYYETMEKVLGRTDKTIIEADGVTPYLPLPEVRRRSRAQPPTPAQSSPPAPIQPQAEGQ